MFIQKTNSYEDYFTLYIHESGGELLFTYGGLREYIGEEGLRIFKEKFGEYLRPERDDNSRVAFNISENEVDKINKELSQL